MATIRLTRAAIAQLPIPERRTRYQDAGQDGLIVAVTPGGRKVFYLFKRLAGRLHEVRIGDTRYMSVAEARARARAIIVDLERDAAGAGLTEALARRVVPRAVDLLMAQALDGGRGLQRRRVRAAVGKKPAAR